MRFFVGTSGYGHKEWKGVFYPKTLPAKDLLDFYSKRFPAVEINASFYRMPSANVVQSWAEQVPMSFQFTMKAPQTITHRKRLQNVEEETNQLIEITATLEERQGPLLFQLPGNFKKDLARLDALLTLLGKRAPAAFEFRHASWFDDEVFAALREHKCVLCVAESEEFPVADLVTTATWGYVRLRLEDYTDNQLRDWIQRLRSHKWNEAYVFFKHEATATGAKLATRFLELVEE